MRNCCLRKVLLQACKVVDAGACGRSKPPSFISSVVSKLRLETYGVGEYITRQGEYSELVALPSMFATLSDRGVHQLTALLDR